MNEGKIGGRFHLASKLCDQCYNCVNICCTDTRAYAILERGDLDAATLIFCNDGCFREWLARQVRMRTGREDQIIFHSLKDGSTYQKGAWNRGQGS